MAQINCNFHSYSIRCPIEIEVTLPSISSMDGRDGTPPTHALPAKFPVLYLLHGGGNDYRCWLRYTSAERYAEEHRIALVTCSVGGSSYEDREWGKYYQLLSKELPELCAATSQSPTARRTPTCAATPWAIRHNNSLASRP